MTSHDIPVEIRGLRPGLRQVHLGGAEHALLRAHRGLGHAGDQRDLGGRGAGLELGWLEMEWLEMVRDLVNIAITMEHHLCSLALPQPGFIEMNGWRQCSRRKAPNKDRSSPHVDSTK